MANHRHSAYRFRFAAIAYRWHPLFGRRLQVSPFRRGKELTCIYTNERPDLCRELPNWMFDESYCAGMTSRGARDQHRGSYRACQCSRVVRCESEARRTIRSFDQEGGGLRRTRRHRTSELLRSRNVNSGQTTAEGNRRAWSRPGPISAGGSGRRRRSLEARMSPEMTPSPRRAAV